MQIPRNISNMADSESEVMNATTPVSAPVVSVSITNTTASSGTEEPEASIVTNSDDSVTMTKTMSIPSGATITTRVTFGTTTGHESVYSEGTTESTIIGITTGSILEDTISSPTCSCGGNSDNAPLARTHYRVYLVTYMTTDLSHHAICVETNPEKRSSDWGRLFQVNGNLYEGMYHEFKTCQHPFHSQTGHTMQHIGWVRRQGSRLEEVCGRIPAPKRQWNDKLKRINPDEPVRHCQHWVVDAVTALGDSGVLQPRTADDDGSVMVRPGGLWVDRGRSAQGQGLQLPIQFW